MDRSSWERYFGLPAGSLVERSIDAGPYRYEPRYKLPTFTFRAYVVEPKEPERPS